MDENNGSLGNQPSPVNAGGAVPTPTNPTMPSTPDGAMTDAPMPEAPVASEMPSTPGIIASTPEVAAPPSDEEVANASANLTPRRPFFADHPTQTTASGTGDIILEKTKTPGSKKPLIIALIIGAVVLVVVVVLLMVNRPVSSEELAQSFSEYRNLLENGPAGAEIESTNISEAVDTEDEIIDNEETQIWDNYEEEDEDGDDSEFIDDNDEEEEDEDVVVDIPVEEVYDDSAAIEESMDSVYTDPEYMEWFFFNLGASNLSSEDRKAYIEDLKAKYDKISKMISRVDKKAAQYSELQDITVDYGDLLNCLGRFALLGELSSEVTERYLNEGVESAQQYIDEVVSSENEESLLGSLNTILRTELESTLDELEIYNKLGCIVDGEVEDCDGEGNKEYDTFFEKRIEDNFALEISLSSVQNLFYEETETISRLIKEMNDA